MKIEFPAGVRPPNKQDWQTNVCRHNYALAIAAKERFGRDFRLVKIVWDKAEGYPEHAWGYTQWTVRPVWPGFGCDGTTDTEHHARAQLILARLGLDADVLYARAYPGHGEWKPSDARECVKQGVDYIVRANEPPTQENIADMLYDLGATNNHSYVTAIVEELEMMGIPVPEDYSNPSVRLDYAVPPGEGVVVRTDKDESGTRRYYLSDGYIRSVLFVEENHLRRPVIRGFVWQDDRNAERMLETAGGVRERARLIEGLIKAGKAPQNILEFAETL